MSDNVLQTLQKLVQDVIAPDVRETKVRLEGLAKSTDARFDALQKQMDFRFEAIDSRFDSVDQRFSSMESSVDSRFTALEKQMSSMERTILSAIAESRAQAELTSMAAVATHRERVAVLESKHN